MNIKSLQQPIQAAFCCLLIAAVIIANIMMSSVALAEPVATIDSTASQIPAFQQEPRWTEYYLFKNNPELLKDTHLDHVLSFYYFGTYKDFTIMGMERVRGDDYHQYNTVLIFKQAQLQGYYQDLQVFPAGISAEGVIKFPANNDVVDHINLAEHYYPALVFAQDKKRNPATYAISEMQRVGDQ